jgi:hypothetical protein
MGNSLLAETLEEVAAANEYVRAKEERALAAGRSVYFMDDESRFFERNREGVFEIVQGADGRWVRAHELARRLDEREPELDQALAR